MKYKKSMMKKLLSSFLATTLLFAMPAQYAFAAQTYYKQTTQETVSRGVSYESSSRITDAGVQNIHVLKVDLTESTLEFKAVDSNTEYGLKETVKKMMQDNGAVAGVNADFFGLTGTYSASFGPVVVDGDVVSGGTTLNKEKDEYAAYFFDEDDRQFFDYFKMWASFSNGTKTLELASINKVTSMVFPIYFDQEVAETTADIDKRFDGLVKFVVEYDEIVAISQPGELAIVPEDGYLIVMSKDYYTNSASVFMVGDEVEMSMHSSVDLDAVEQSFGGGGKLLVGGAEAPATSIVAAGRQPRTAFGVSHLGDFVIFMVVDGRGDSVGATHAEMAALMKEYGAHEAMHLDGGGSSTMVAQTLDDTEVVVKNTVSEGSERKVINGVGIFQTAELGDIEEIGITQSLNRTLANKTITFQVYGLDEYYNKIAIPASEVQLDAIGVAGSWNGYDFTPSETGTFTVTAIYDDMSAVKQNVVSAKTSYLQPSSTSISLGVGQTAKVAMQVADTDGFSHWVSTTTQYAVADTSVGTMESNVFTAKNTGATYIKCTRDGQEAYISVVVGDAKAGTLPQATRATDPLRGTVTKQDDGAYYVNIAGALAYSGNTEINADVYTGVRETKRDVIDSKAEVAIYGGKTDVTGTTQLDSLSWTGGYRFLNRGGASIVMVSAAKGGITATDPTQWMNFTRDIEAADNGTVIFVMDKTPSNFTSAAEAAYFRAVLGKYVDAGKNVMVVSCSTTAQWASIKDGVRYINLPNLWTTDGKVNDKFGMLKLRVQDSQLTYEFVKI